MMSTPPPRFTILSVLVLMLASSCQSFSIQPPRQRSAVLKTTKLHGSYFDDEDEGEREFSRIRRGGRGTRVMDYDDDERIMDDLEDVVNDYYDDDDDNEFDGIIPNPLLDNIDPEGSAERIGELFSDRQFWIDIGLLFLFLNFLDNLRDPAVFDAIDIATMQ